MIDVLSKQDFIFIAAASKLNIQELKDKILSHFHITTLKTGDVIVTNLRHYQNLLQTHESLDRVLVAWHKA